MTLRVRVFSGRNLIGADLGGKSDPYVILEIGTSRKKTKVKNSCRHPDWMECKDIPLNKGLNDELLVTVKDHDFLGSDVIGLAKVNLTSIPLNPGEEHVLLLSLQGGEAGENLGAILSHVASSALKSAMPGSSKKKKEEPESSGIPVKNHGSISLGLTYFDTAPPRAVPMKKQNGPFAQPGQACVLTVIAIGAAQLNAADLGTKPKSDPYCQLTVQKKKVKTKSCKKTLEPKWHQMFSIAVPDGANDFLLVKVKDRDLIGRSDSLGTAQVNLGQLAMDIDQIVTLKLEGGDIGENVKMAADQVADDAGSAVITTVASKKGGKLAGSAAAKITGSSKRNGHALSGARSNYGTVCLMLRLTSQP